MKELSFLAVFLCIQPEYPINLVINPSFEEFRKCPQNFTSDRLEDVLYWTMPTDGTSDYFRTCGGSNVGIPKNYFGSQEPRTGDSYGGFYAFTTSGASPDYREYLQVRLKAPLVKGQTYYVEFYISLAETHSSHSINQLGAYFSRHPVYTKTYGVLHQVPQVISDPAKQLSDTKAWIQVSGEFEAEGGELFLTIGNFNSNEKTEMMPLKGKNQKENYGFVKCAYYYIDDVKVIAGYP